MVTNAELHNELLAYFKGFLDKSDKSEATKVNIIRDTKAFLVYLEKNEDGEIESSTVLRYINFLNDKYHESSFVTKSSSIRQFINWINLDNNPFWNLKMSNSFEDYEVYDKKEFYSELDNQSKLFLCLYYELYLKVDDFISLTLRNYNQAGACINFEDKKIKISQDLNNSLKEYLAQRKELVESKEGVDTLESPLFMSLLDMQALTANKLTEIAFANKKKLSVVKRSRVIHLLDEGKSISEVEEQLSTSLSEFFERFVKKENYRLLNAYNQFHPRARRS